MSADHVDCAKGRRRFCLKIGLLVVSTLFAYATCEIAYRIRHFQVLTQKHVAALTGDSGDIYDPDTGYHYRPNTHVEVESPFPIRYSTNSLGNIQDDDYPIEKPAGEFRIVAIGDSFTANVTNTVRWTALLQERLQGDTEWVRAIQYKQTRVINLGLDGLGIVQFDDVYFKDAVRLNADLILINVITDDIPRRPYHRGSLDLSTEHARQDCEREISKRIWTSLPWTSPWPELLATSVGRRLGIRSILDPAKISGRMYTDDDEAIANSLAALRRVFQAHPHVIVLWHPMYEELVDEPRDYWRDLRPRLFLQGTDLKIVDTEPYYPKSRERDEVRKWFNLPHDVHNSDLGLRHHAAAVHETLRRHPQQAGINSQAIVVANNSANPQAPIKPDLRVENNDDARTR